MTKDNNTAPKSLSLDKLAEMLADDKTRADMKYPNRSGAAQDLCKTIPDIRVRAALIDILTQSMIVDENVPPYRDLPERYFAGAQEYWKDKKDTESLLFLPKNVFSTDKQLCEYYLDDILPECDAHHTQRINIARSLRTADCYMFLLTQYDLIALQPCFVRSVTTELGSALEEILRSVATTSGRVPETPYDLVTLGLITPEEQEQMERKRFSWGDAPEHDLIYHNNSSDSDDAPSQVMEPFRGDRLLTLGSFGLVERDEQLTDYVDHADITKCNGKNAIVTALKHKRKLQLLSFNRALHENGNRVMETEKPHTDAGDYVSWFRRIQSLRNNVHFAALNQDLASTDEFSNLEITSELYAFLHVTVEALKLYVEAMR